MVDDRITRLITSVTWHRSTRRAMLRRASAYIVSMPILGVLLAACRGDDQNSTPFATPDDQPSSTPSPAAPDLPTPTAEATPTPPSEPTATPDTSEQQASGVITIATVTADSGIGNPILTGSVPGIEFYVFSRLVVYDDSGTLQPELAREWTHSEDNRELTLTLTNATWHDGKPFTADDVIFTFDTIRSETTATNRRANLRVASEYISWEKIDDVTVRLSSPVPFAPLLFQLSQLPIIPEHLLADSANINDDLFNRAPVGTGPYRLGDWQPDRVINLVAFDEHFRGRPRNTGLSYVFFPSPDAAAAALADGSVDLMYAPPRLHSQLAENPDVTLYRYVYFTPVTLAFNHRHPILQDVTVRQAISRAVDKRLLAAEATGDEDMAAHNQFADGGPLERFNDYDNVQPIERDISAANRMLDDAEYGRGDDDIRIAPNGDRLSFNLMTYAGFEEYQAVQLRIQEMLAEIGIEVLAQIVDYTTLEIMWLNPSDPPSARALEIQEWPRPFEFDPDLYGELHSDNVPPGSNVMWFSDGQVDQLIEQGRTTTDMDARVDIYRQLDVRRAEVLPSLPLYNAVDAWVVSNRVQGLRASPYFRRYVLTHAQDWWKDE